MKFSEAVKMLFDCKIESAKIDAKLLFKHFAGFKDHEFLSNDPTSDSESLEDAIKRRCAREPLQYIIGEVDFYNENYLVSPDCLIPRSDTEILVDFAIKNLPSNAKFLDLCTGSGCIAISTLKNTVGTQAVCVDISKEALLLAKKNAERNGVSKRAEFILLDVLTDKADGKYFAVLSNPPYVRDDVYNTLEAEIFKEPKIAFVGGEDGLNFYKRIISTYKDSLDRNGFFAFEIGYDQADDLKKIAKIHGFDVEIIKDYSSNDRVAILKQKNAI